MANLIISPRASACGTCIPRPSPRSPSTHYPPITRPGGRGEGPTGIAREGAGTPGAPLAPRFPAGSPAGRRWAQLKWGGGSRHLMPARERGAVVPGLSCPLGHCLGLAQNPAGRKECMCPSPTPWAPRDPPPTSGPLEQGLGSCLPGLFPPRCAGLWGQSSRAPTPRWPICFLGSPPPAPLTWSLPS